MVSSTNSRLILPAIILAGAPAEPELEAKYSVKNRAEVPVEGKTMITRVLDALKASPLVGDICVVGDIQCDGASRIIPPAGSLMENLIAGMKACGSDGHVLVATSDIPLLTTAAVDDFIERCGDLEADFYYPVIPKDANEKQFPGIRRTYARLAEGTFTGGNIMVINARFLSENADLIYDVIAARKSVVKLARLIGLGVLLRVVIAQVLWAKAINLNLLEKIIGRILNAKIKAIQTPYAEIGADVDDLEQLEAVEALLAPEGERK